MLSVDEVATRGVKTYHGSHPAGIKLVHELVPGD